jgi:hypothetical protein
VQDCYRLYAQHKPEQLANERVQAWLDDCDTSNLLREFAGVPGRRLAAAA